MLAALSSSARGGRSSAAMTRVLRFSCSTSSLTPLAPRTPECRTSSLRPPTSDLQTPYTSLLTSLESLPRLTLAPAPTPVEEMARLRAALGAGPTLLVKRDDAIPFGFGGNKIRKLQV